MTSEQLTAMTDTPTIAQILLSAAERTLETAQAADTESEG